MKLLAVRRCLESTKSFHSARSIARPIQYRKHRSAPSINIVLFARRDREGGRSYLTAADEQELAKKRTKARLEENCNP